MIQTFSNRDSKKKVEEMRFQFFLLNCLNCLILFSLFSPFSFNQQVRKMRCAELITKVLDIDDKIERLQQQGEEEKHTPIYYLSSPLNNNIPSETNTHFSQNNVSININSTTVPTNNNNNYSSASWSVTGGVPQLNNVPENTTLPPVPSVKMAKEKILAPTRRAFY